MLIKSLFKSSFGQSNVVLRGRFVICSGDLCVADNAGRQATVVVQALFFSSAVAKAFIVVVVVVVSWYFLIMFVNDRSRVLHTTVADL